VLSLIPESNVKLDERKKTHTVLAIRNLIFVTVIGMAMEDSTAPTWVVRYSPGLLIINTMTVKEQLQWMAKKAEMQIW